MKKEEINLWERLYVGFTMRSAATRKHSLDILACPSRMGSKLYYPNGEVRNDHKRPD
jgi:hypothetical protein